MKTVLVATGLSLLITATGAACIFLLTRWNLEVLGKVQPLSWGTVDLVWSYAWGFTAITVLMLVALALILTIAEAAWQYRIPEND